MQQVANLLGIDKLLARYRVRSPAASASGVANGPNNGQEPGVFLFDEPLSNDAQLRMELRAG